MSAKRALAPVIIAYVLVAALFLAFYTPADAPVTIAPNDGAARGILYRNGRAYIDMNTADTHLLQALYGIGGTLAKRVIAYRDKHGAFTELARLTRVSGISPSRLERIRDRIALS